MALTDRLFRRAKRSAEVDLGPLQAWFSGQAARLAGKAPDPELVRARLADGLRDTGLVPPLPEVFDGQTADLLEPAWQRLALLVSALDVPELRAVLPVLCSGGRSPDELVGQGFVGVARSTSLLTLELLRQASVRVEEFTRRFLAGLGVSVRGEPEERSRQRLEQLDYGRLLEQVEQAKLSAEERLEVLRRIQDEQDRRAQRGKW